MARTKRVLGEGEQEVVVVSTQYEIVDGVEKVLVTLSDASTYTFNL